MDPLVIIPKLDGFLDLIEANRGRLKQIVDEQCDAVRKDVVNLKSRILANAAVDATARPSGAELNKTHAGKRRSQKRQKKNAKDGEGSSNRKRKRRQPQQPRLADRPKKARVEAETSTSSNRGGNENKGAYKVIVKKIKCTECKASLQSARHYSAHLKRQHQLSPYRCLLAGCGQRFTYM